jgi:hypothetical protein
MGFSFLFITSFFVGMLQKHAIGVKKSFDKRIKPLAGGAWKWKN